MSNAVESNNMDSKELSSVAQNVNNMAHDRGQEPASDSALDSTLESESEGKQIAPTDHENGDTPASNTSPRTMWRPRVSIELIMFFCPWAVHF
jgi:hypothetical protein